MDGKTHLTLSPRSSPVGRERTPTPEGGTKSPPFGTKWSFFTSEGVWSKDKLDEASASPVAKMVLQTCRSCQQRMQSAVDLLLTASDEARPLQAVTACTLNRSMGRCRDKLLGLARQLMASLRSLVALLSAGLARSRETCVCLEEICESVVALIEACAKTVYVQAAQCTNSNVRPLQVATFDRYSVCCAATSIERKLASFRRLSLEELTAGTRADICRHVSDCIDTIENLCSPGRVPSPSRPVLGPELRDLLRKCAQSVRASGDALKAVAGSQREDKLSAEMLACCQAFADAVTTSCHALIAFTGAQPALSGQPAQKLDAVARQRTWTLISAAMGVVTPCIFACDLVCALTCDPNDSGAQAKIQGCLSVVARGHSKLAKAVGVTVVHITT